MGVDYEMTLPVLCEHVEVGEGDGGEESVGYCPIGPDHQGPNVHRPLSWPSGPREGLHGRQDDGQGREDAHSGFSQFQRPAKQGNEYPGIIFGNNK